MVEVRRFQPDELNQYRALTRHAGDWRDGEVTPEEVSWIEPDSAWGVFQGGEPVSVLRNIPFRQGIRGVEKRMGGIGGVATHPLHRRRGHVRRLMTAAFQEMHENGQVVSTLYPFKESFYSAFGYITANPNLRVEVPGATLAHHMEAARRTAERHDVELQPMADTRAEMYAFYRSAVFPRHNGYVIDPDRLPVSWSIRSRNTLLLVVRVGGCKDAVARYRIENRTLFIDELHWRTLAGRGQVLGYLAGYADQASTFCFRNLPLGTNIHAWLRDPPQELDARLSPQAPMARVIDPVGALTDLPAHQDGEVVFTLRDAQCAWNEGVYRVTAEDGRLSAAPVNDRAELELSVEGLTALIHGIFSPGEIAFRGWLSGLDEKTSRLLSLWFPCEPMFNPYHF